MPLSTATFRRCSTASCLLAFATFLPHDAYAQHGGGGAAPPLAAAPREATQFDFLVGQWELVVKPKPTSLAQRIHGPRTLDGTWRAWRALDGWGIEDELRITDRSGNTLAYSHHVRWIDARTHRWNVSVFEPSKGSTSSSTAVWANSTMTSSGIGTDPQGRAFMARATFSDITPTSFTYRLDRSYDGGKEWEEGITRIDAKRVGTSARP